MLVNHRSFDSNERTHIPRPLLACEYIPPRRPLLSDFGKIRYRFYDTFLPFPFELYGMPGLPARFLVRYGRWIFEPLLFDVLLDDPRILFVDNVQYLRVHVYDRISFCHTSYFKAADDDNRCKWRRESLLHVRLRFPLYYYMAGRKE